MKNKKLSISIIMPCYNEAKNIRSCIEKTLVEIKKLHEQKILAELIIINDGSNDETEKILNKLSDIKLIHNLKNLGNGNAIKKGVLASSSEYILLIDSDGQHPPENISSLVSHIGNNDMIVGARSKYCVQSFHRKIGNFCLSKFASLVTNYNIKDLTSGFRIIKRDVFLRFIHLIPDKFSYSTTITIAMLKNNLSITYETFNNITFRRFGKSTINPIIDGLNFLKIILKIIYIYDSKKILFASYLTSVILFIGIYCVLKNFIS